MFRVEDAGAGLAGTNGAAASGANGGGKGSAGGASGAAPGSGSCVANLECASQPHVRPGALATCFAGQCLIPPSSCEEGFTHCTASGSEYCETSLDSPSNCGACGKTCSGATPLCLDGQCASACSSAKPTDCGGTCVDTTTNLENCGACGQSCSVPNATANCSQGTCDKTACKTGFADCNSVAAGCETRLNTPTDCGACGNKCGSASDLASCATGTCAVTCTSRAEDCFNGKDDDCDALVDCADSNCTAIAMCVPEPSEPFAYGTEIAEQSACPAAFAGDAVVVHSGLDSGGGCSGCGCNPTTIECGPGTLEVYSYLDACMTPGPKVASVALNQFSTACSPVMVSGAWNGFSLSTTTKQNCTTTGKASFAPATWTDNRKFCPASIEGAGCSAGKVCVPVPAASACLLASGYQSCPASFPKQRTVYDSLSDNRACNCSCNASGGSCLDLVLEAYNSSSDCSAAASLESSYSNGANVCAPAGSYTQFAYRFTGTPKAPSSCEPSNDLSGTVVSNGPHTLCCQ